eukprot:CAMPEP_0197550194 /NCGR_PEP_ID=MMETSP1320-20131121/3874_1 /TAXON_ID=91990 /ORGANISM="Bolidomonas sp., Strain RCC2347" /LENGTH=1341 /DNA_ID=CAMNT_0043110533 /DNA_START=18 /DNA_END=4043 /DNA_ORIENTATION=-
MGDRSEENQLDWSGEFSLGDLLDGDVQREIIDEGPPLEGAASSIGEGNLLPGYTQVQGDEMQQNLTTATNEGAGSPPRKARMRNPKEAKMQNMNTRSEYNKQVYGNGVAYWAARALKKVSTNEELTHHEAFALLYVRYSRRNASKNFNKLGASLSKVPTRGSASPVAPHMYRSFFVGPVTDSVATKGPKSQEEVSQLLSVSYQALSNGKIWWWNDEKDMKKSDPYMLGSCCRMMGKKTRKGKLSNVTHGYAGRFYSLVRAKKSDIAACAPGSFKNAPFHSSPVETAVVPDAYGFVQFWNDLDSEESTDKRKAGKDAQDKQDGKKVKCAAKNVEKDNAAGNDDVVGSGQPPPPQSTLSYYDYPPHYNSGIPDQQSAYLFYQQQQQQQLQQPLPPNPSYLSNPSSPHPTHSSNPTNSSESSSMSEDNTKNLSSLVDYTLRGSLTVTGDVTVLGKINGSLQTAPTAADYAEQFLKDEAEKDAITPGSVVRLRLPAMTLTLNTTAEPSAVLMVVSTNPSISAGVNQDSLEDGTGAMCAFVGVVPIRVKGRVKAGAVLIPSGLNDGCAITTISRLAPLNHVAFSTLGVAMEDTPPSALDNVDCESRILCLIHPQSSQPSLVGAKPMEATTSQIKKSKVVPTSSSPRSNQLVTYVDAHMYRNDDTEIMSSFKEETSVDLTPLSPEFHRLEVVNRKRPWLLSYVMAITYVTISFSQCYDSNTPDDILAVANSEVIRLVRDRLWAKNSTSQSMYFLTGSVTFIYQLVWCNFDVLSMVKKSQNKVALKDALTNQIFLANAALALACLAVFMAVSACLFQCEMGRALPDGFSAWSANMHFKTAEQHYFALSALIFLHLLWVVFFIEAYNTTQEVKQVCKKLLSDSKAFNLFHSFTRAHVVNMGQGVFTFREVRRTFCARPVLFILNVLVSIGFYNIFTVAVLTPVLAVTGGMTFWLDNNSFNMYRWSDSLKMSLSERSHERSHERSRSVRSSNERSQRSSSGQGGESQSEAGQSTAGEVVAGLNDLAAAYFPGWKLVFMAVAFNFLNYAFETCFCWHYSTLFFTCADSMLEEEETNQDTFCMYYETGESDTLSDVLEHLKKSGSPTATVHDICDANPLLVYDHLDGQCNLSDALPEHFQVKLPGTCASLPLDVIEQCLFYSSRDRYLHFLWHATTFVLLTWSIRCLLLERRMTQAKHASCRLKRYASSSEAFLCTFFPFIMASHLNTDVIDRELTQSDVLNYDKMEGNAKTRALTSSSWSDSSGSGSGQKKKRKVVRHVLSLAKTNRLKFYATLLSATTLVFISLPAAVYFIRRIEPGHFICDTGEGCEGCSGVFFRIGEGGSIFDPFMFY